jgi:hypothetical protein
MVGRFKPDQPSVETLSVRGAALSGGSSWLHIGIGLTYAEEECWKGRPQKWGDFGYAGDASQPIGALRTMMSGMAICTQKRLPFSTSSRKLGFTCLFNLETAVSLLRALFAVPRIFSLNLPAHFSATAKLLNPLNWRRGPSVTSCQAADSASCFR